MGGPSEEESGLCTGGHTANAAGAGAKAELNDGAGRADFGGVCIAFSLIVLAADCHKVQSLLKARQWVATSVKTVPISVDGDTGARLLQLGEEDSPRKLMNNQRTWTTHI